MFKIYKIIILLIFVSLPSSSNAHVQHYDDLNRIADGIAAVKEEDRSLMKLFSIAVSKKPTLLIDVMRLFTGL